MFILVRERRLELLRFYPLDPKSSASANSATLARDGFGIIYSLVKMSTRIIVRHTFAKPVRLQCRRPSVKYNSPECKRKMWEKWSGRVDLNHRPSEPHSDTLPDCATPRHDVLLMAEAITTFGRTCQEQTQIQQAVLRPMKSIGESTPIFRLNKKHPSGMITP